MVLSATNVEILWDIKHAGHNAVEQYGSTLPNETLESIRRNKVALKGPITTPRGGGFRSVNVTLRKLLDLYACIRPAKSCPGTLSRYQDVDITVIRENHEDLYAGVEFEMGDPAISRISEITKASKQGSIPLDAGLSLKIISQSASERIVRFAFDYARQNGYKKITSVTKDNIMKYTDGIFSATAREIAKEYPEIQHEETLIDALTMQLVIKPENFDVLVLPNLYGDIVSDLCAGLIGGLGIAPGANLGDEIAVFEAVHGSAPTQAGLNTANPMAMILSSALMLHYLGEQQAAQQIEEATIAVIADGKFVTQDMKPTMAEQTAASTSQVADAVVEALHTIRKRDG